MLRNFYFLPKKKKEEKNYPKMRRNFFDIQLNIIRKLYVSSLYIYFYSIPFFLPFIPILFFLPSIETVNLLRDAISWQHLRVYLYDSLFFRSHSLSFICLCRTLLVKIAFNKFVQTEKNKKEKKNEISFSTSLKNVDSFYYTRRKERKSQ